MLTKLIKWILILLALPLWVFLWALSGFRKFGL
jgi:hypothetical protein